MRSFPSDWEVKELKEINIEIVDGDRGVNYPKQTEFLPEGYCLFLNTGNIKEDQFAFAENNFISEERDNLLRKGKLKRKDIVLTTRGTVGSVAYYKPAIPYEHMRINSGMVIMRCGDGLDTNFIYQLLKSPFVKEQYRMFSSGSAQPQLPIKDLRKIPLLIPPLPVQQKIAAILSAYDDLIENNNKRIALLEKVAEEIYREWFVRMRFPDWKQVKFVKGVPEGWEVIKVADAFEFLGGGTPSTTEKRYWDDGTVNWFTPSDITKANGIFLPESIDKCTEEGLNNSSARMFPAYSIMMTSRATIGAIGINTTPACTNQGFITCIPNENFPITFLYHWLKLNKHYFETVSTGSTFLELTKGTFKKIKILKPEKKLVEQYESKVQPMFKEMEFLLQKVDLLKKSRDLLLSRLISGKLSVEGLDIRFPESMM